MAHFRIGTVLKISDTIVPAPDSASITIDDPAGNEVVADAAMILESGTTYYYIYQSGAAAAGTYTITLKAVSGTYTALVQKKFELLPQE